MFQQKRPLTKLGFGKDVKSERHLKEGEEVLIYENIKHKSEHFSLFLIFNSHTSEDIKEVIRFKIKDGIVTSYSVN